MSTLRDYLANVRGIDVSPDDAHALDAYWATLRGRRTETGAFSTEDLPVIFDPTESDIDA